MRIYITKLDELPQHTGKLQIYANKIPLLLKLI